MGLECLSSRTPRLRALHFPPVENCTDLEQSKIFYNFVRCVEYKPKGVSVKEEVILYLFR